MTNKVPRQVYIDELSRHGKLLTYVVCYVSRARRQRYYAAQFDPAVGLESVQGWVNRQDGLELVDKPVTETTATRIEGRR